MPHDRAQNSALRPPPPQLDTRTHALFLDLDGTLVAIAARPEDVVAGNGLRALLGALIAETEGAVAVLTGRTIESAEAVLRGAVANIAGLHGFERRFDGAVTRAEADLSPVQAASAEAHALVQRGLRARVEDKQACVALHFRDAPDAADEVRRLAADLAEKHGLTVLEGKMVAELTLGVRDKGDALVAFMQEAPFYTRIPIAVGDDITDEDAFVAAAAAGGFGVLVGERAGTAAQYALRDADAVTRWLEARRS